MSTTALLEGLGAVGEVPAAPVFYERFGRALAQRRRSAGLSQKTMATCIGLSRTAVTNIEAGRQSVSLHTALAFASIVGCTLPDLVTATQRDILHVATPKGRGRSRSGPRETSP